LKGPGAVPRQSAITPGVPSVPTLRVSAANPSLLPVGIDSGGYDHRRKELASTVTARGSELWRKG
jgi:hypothetical protein